MTDAANIDTYIHSLEQVYQPRARAAVLRALERFAEAIMGEAQELAPVSPPGEFITGKKGNPIQNPLWTGHSGALKASGVVEDAVYEDNIAKVTLGFNTDYAAAVHEILTHFHAQGQAKYLEKPMMEMAPKLGAFILEELQKEFG